MLVLPSGPALAEALRACWANGLVAIPRDPKSKQNVQVAEHAQVHARVDVDGVHPNHVVHPLSPLHDRLILYTSGSTGDPKGVVLTEAALKSNAVQVANRHDFASGAHATCLSLHHCNAICGSLYGTMLTDSRLIISGSSDMTAYFSAIETHRVCTATIVPALLEKLLASPPRWPSRLKYLITAAAPLTRDLARRFRDVYGEERLVQGYGMTEAVNFSTTMPNLAGKAWSAAYVNQHPPVGAPLPGTELRVEDGEVQVRGLNLMREYWRNPEATAEKYTSDGWFKTGDVGFVGDDGLLRLSGRISEGINWRGAMTYPTDFEESWALNSPGCAISERGVCVPVVDPDGREHPAVVGCLTAVALGLNDPPPMAMDSGPVQGTLTFKPRRRSMSTALTCRFDDDVRYEALRITAFEVYSMMDYQSLDALQISSVQERWIVDRALEFRQKMTGARLGDKRLARIGGAWNDVWSEALQALGTQWGAHDAEHPKRIITEIPSLWRRLMHEWPMGVYGDLVADIIARRGLLHGRALEFGTGVGNTSGLLNRAKFDELFLTDLQQSTKRGVRAWNFDCGEPYTVGLDLIFGTNALHCSKSPTKALHTMFTMLKPGGHLVIGEGEAHPYRDEPWALHAFFGLFDGWWDVGGFLTRRGWVELLERTGFVDVGWSVFRAGRFDLGGALWARRP